MRYNYSMKEDRLVFFRENLGESRGSEKIKSRIIFTPGAKEELQNTLLAANTGVEQLSWANLNEVFRHPGALAVVFSMIPCSPCERMKQDLLALQKQGYDIRIVEFLSETNGETHPEYDKIKAAIKSRTKIERNPFKGVPAVYIRGAGVQSPFSISYSCDTQKGCSTKLETIFKQKKISKKSSPKPKKS